MPLLVAAVAVLGALTGLNLLLSAAVIRLLRDHGRAGLPRVGDRIGRFTAAAADGAPITDQALRSGEALVAFLSPSCPPCRALVPSLVERVGELPAPAIAFVIGEPAAEDSRRYAAGLRPAMRVALVGPGSAPARAFGVTDVTPTLVRVVAGVVAAVGHDLDAVLATAPLAGPLG